MKKYQHVADMLMRQISAGSLKPGQKLPSVRASSRMTGFSVVTVHHGYAILESEGIIEAKARSGFVVAREPLAETGELASREGAWQRPAPPISVTDLNYRVMSSWCLPDVEAFGAIYPSSDVFQNDRIRQHMRRVLTKNNLGPEINDPQGLPQLREAITKRLALQRIAASPDDIVVTGSGLQGLDIALGSVTKPGDTVIVESPVFFPQLDAVRRRGLLALELYSHPRHGVDPDQFGHLLGRNRIAACILMPVNHYPTGTTYPAATLEALVREASRRGIPIIENAIFNDLTYSGRKPASLKACDGEDYVIQFSSCPGVSLSGYGISWLTSRRYRKQLVEQRFFTNLFTGEGHAQQAFTNYLQTENYERALHRMQRTLHARMTRGRDLLTAMLPPGTSISTPAGGYMCWLRGPQDFDATAASLDVLSHKISLPPGQMFSPSGAYRNFVGLNFSFDWTAERVGKLERICGLIGADQAVGRR